MKRQWAAAVLVTCLLQVHVYVGLSASANGDMKKNAALLRHRVFLENAYRSGKGSSAEWMRTALGGMGTVPLSQKDWSRLVVTLVQDSKNGMSKGGGSGFVKDDQVVDLLVSALEDSGAGKLQVVLDALTWDVSDVQKKKYAGRIREALGPRPKYSEGILLFAKCELSSQQKQEVCSWDETPIAARALCGDSKAEEDLVLKFKKSVEYFEKSILARQLAYVGTPSCRNALLDGLRSSVVHESEYERCSIRGKILLALGMLYEQESLFTIDAYLLDSNSDEVFDKRRGLKKYVEDVNIWTLKRFGRSAWDGDEVWFRVMKNVPLVE